MINLYLLKRLNGDIMKKTFFKTILRDFKKNITRLIAIVAIVALGVGFLVGLLSSTPDLENSMNNYYNETNTYDILIKSTIGFSKYDIESLKKDIDLIEYIEGYNQMDYISSYNNEKIYIRKVMFDLSSQINKISLIDGRLPTNNDECLVQNFGIFSKKNSIGKKMIVEEKEFTIVGVCNSPLYYYHFQEVSTIGDGSLDCIIYTEINDDSEITDISIRLKDSDNYHSFKDEYFKYIKPIEKQISDLSNKYLENRFNDLYNDFLEEFENNLLLQGYSQLEISKMIELQKEEIRQNLLLELGQMKWYILNRNDNLSYTTYKSNAIKVQNVSIVFPFFFFFIAALISLTSVSRLVSEDRTSIGTLKSLGYSNIKILSKYIIYALFACLIGCILGLLIGVYFLPSVIYYCYNTLFVMPKGYFSWHLWCVLLSTISMCLVIFIVMIYVCFKSLHEKPNALLIPKAPKPGKTLLLEKCNFIWGKMKFKYKSSIRNIFRFKRNLIMMIVGVGGCTGLMLIGLGLNDSLTSPAKLQFNDVLYYDISLSINKEINLDFFNDSEIIFLYKEDGIVNENENYKVEVLYSSDNICNFINLEKDALPNDGVIISSELAEKFKLKKGSYIDVLVENESKTFLVSSIFSNYIGNYIIVNNSDKINNMVYIKLGEKDNNNFDDIMQKIYLIDGSISVTNLNSNKEMYANLTSGTEFIVLVIVLFSGLLAIIVIYNLTNININERIKEIATLKVLGYHRKEILGYIYREIIIMSILGILVGFIIGPLLNIFVMDKISSPGQMFNKILSPINYLYATLITSCFVGIVLLLFIPKIRKIKMVESLKSVE